jgi:hypothetical protein
VRRNLTHALAELDAAEVQGEVARLSQALAQVAECYHAADMAAHRRWYLQQALRFAALLSAVDAKVDLLCQLAEACVDDLHVGADDSKDTRRSHGTRDLVRDHVFEAAQLAGRSADPRWEVTVLLRLGAVLDGLGDHDDAAALQRRALALIDGRGAQRDLIG